MLDNFLAEQQVGMKLSKSHSYGKSKENIFLRKGVGGVKDKLYVFVYANARKKIPLLGAILPVISCITELTNPNDLNMSSALLVLTPIVII